MKITHVCTRLYPQVWKAAIAQQELGWDVRVITLQISDMAAFLPHLWLVPNGGPYHFGQMLEQTEGTLVVYTSIADYGFMMEALECRPSLQARTFVHVNYYLPRMEMDEEILNCAGVIVPARQMMQHFENAHWLPNKAPRHFLQPVLDERHKGICLVADLGDNAGEAYRDFHWAEAECHRHGYPLLIWSARRPKGEYTHVMVPEFYPRLLELMGRHTAGWAGAGNDRHNIHECCTNKFWDYLAAGIPVVLFNSNSMWNELDDICCRHEIAGRLYVEPADLTDRTARTDRWEDEASVAREMLSRIPRDEFAMEPHLPELAEFLERADC